MHGSYEQWTEQLMGLLRPKGKPRNRPLTMKQLAFVRWYCSAEVKWNGTVAARRAGYNGSDATLAVVAAENIRKPRIRAEIDRRMDLALSAAGITIEKVLGDLEVIRVSAMAARKYSAAVRCCELQGKYLRMWNGKKELDHSIDDLSTEDLVKLVHEIAETGGINLVEVLGAHGSAKC